MGELVGRHTATLEAGRHSVERSSTGQEGDDVDVLGEPEEPDEEPAGEEIGDEPDDESLEELLAEDEDGDDEEEEDEPDDLDLLSRESVR
jgi:hypothetical protein